jgi:hypothetical protein
VIDKEEFNRAVIGKSPARDDQGIVQNEEIPRAKQHFQLSKPSMFDRLLLTTKHHHPGIFPAFGRPLGN